MLLPWGCATIHDETGNSIHYQHIGAGGAGVRRRCPKKRWLFLLTGLILLVFLVACSETPSVCQPGSITYFDDSTNLAAAPLETSGESIPVEIGRKTIQVDQVIHGPVCNQTLRGTVYVGCDIQIKKWSDKPNFLDGCSFTVEPGTVIYVAAHRDAAYYNGCSSCHTSHANQP